LFFLFIFLGYESSQSVHVLARTANGEAHPDEITDPRG